MLSVEGSHHTPESVDSPVQAREASRIAAIGTHIVHVDLAVGGATNEDLQLGLVEES
jgi:hypothetical protein